jgi:hypothetical protein
MIGYMQGYIKSILCYFWKNRTIYGWQKNLEIYQQVYPDKAAMGTLILISNKLK